MGGLVSGHVGSEAEMPLAEVKRVKQVGTAVNLAASGAETGTAPAHGSSPLGSVVLWRGHVGVWA